MKKEDLNQDLVPQYYRHYVCQVLDSHLLEALVEGKNNFEDKFLERQLKRKNIPGKFTYNKIVNVKNRICFIEIFFAV